MSGAGESRPEEMLAAIVARHFDEPSVAKNVVDLGFVRIACHVGQLRPFAKMHSAQLLFDVSAPELAATTQFSMTSYGPSLAEALAHGACGWTCSFGPVLRAGLSDDVVDGVASFEVEHAGARFRVYVDAYDHVLHFASEGGEDTAAARTRFAAAPWLAHHVLARGTVALSRERPQLLGVFVGESPDRRIVEVKLDGAVQPGFDDLVAAVPPARIKQMVALRELAVVVPD